MSMKLIKKINLLRKVKNLLIKVSVDGFQITSDGHMISSSRDFESAIDTALNTLGISTEEPRRLIKMSQKKAIYEALLAGRTSIEGIKAFAEKLCGTEIKDANITRRIREMRSEGISIKTTHVGNYEYRYSLS